jgi:hypothetical protein
MSNVVPLRLRRRIVDNGHSIRKMINGEVIECLNVDLLTPAQRSTYFGRECAPQQQSCGAQVIKLQC